MPTPALVYYLVAMPVQTNDAYERPLELIVDECVAERVDGTVEVAQPVRDVVECRRNAGTTGTVGGRLYFPVASAAAEPDQERQDVPRRPAERCLGGWSGSRVTCRPRSQSSMFVRVTLSAGSEVAEVLVSATVSSTERTLRG